MDNTKNTFPEIYQRLYPDLMLIGLHQIRIAETMEEIQTVAKILIKLTLDYRRYFSISQDFKPDTDKKD